MRRAGVGMIDDQDVRAVGVPDRVGGEDRAGRAGRHDLAGGQHVDSLAEQGGQAQVVQCGQDGDAEAGDDFEDAHLMRDVEMIGRLVQDSMVGLLGQRPGDQDELFSPPDRVLKRR